MEIKEYKHSIPFHFESVFKSDVGVKSEKIITANCERSFANNIDYLDNLKPLLPDQSIIDANKDLLYVAFPAFNVNLVNKNGHGILTETARKIVSKFIDRPINVEHVKYDIKGHIKNFAFSSFAENKILEDDDEVFYSKKPFNVCLGGVIYKVDEYFADLILESKKEESALYGRLGASWELKFNDYIILVGSKKVEEGRLVDDPREIESLSKYLEVNGGSGFTDNGDPVYLIVSGDDVQPVGIGLTIAPAASVRGILTAKEENSQLGKLEESLNNKEAKIFSCSTDLPEALSKIEDSAKKVGMTINELNDLVSNSIQIKKDNMLTINSPQMTIIPDNYAITTLTVNGTDNLSGESNENVVQKISDKLDILCEKLEKNILESVLTIKANKIMQITSIDELKDEHLKEVQASDIRSLVKKSLQDANQKYEDELAAKDVLQKQVKDFQDSIANYTSQVEQLNAKIKEFEDKEVERQINADFQVRMNDLCNEFDVDENKRKVIAKAIRGLSDEDYSSWKNDFSAFLVAKTKEIKASQEDPTEKLDELDVQAKSNLPNVQKSENSDLEELKKSFAKGGWEIK